MSQTKNAYFIYWRGYISHMSRGNSWNYIYNMAFTLPCLDGMETLNVWTKQRSSIEQVIPHIWLEEIHEAISP